MRIETLMMSTVLMAMASEPAHAQDVPGASDPGQPMSDMPVPPASLPQPDSELPSAEAPVPSLTVEQQAAYDMLPPDRQAAFLIWPSDVQAYYWQLPQPRQDLFWRLGDGDRMALGVMDADNRAAAWDMIEARIAAMEGPQLEMNGPEMDEPQSAEPETVEPDEGYMSDPDSIPDPM